MSDRQMARAAVDGRLITFIQELDRYEESGRSISGFLVGADDYHWMIVPEVSIANIPSPEQEDWDADVILVHKSCAFVMISSSIRLSDRHSRIQERVSRVGQRFWDHCKQVHLGYTATTPQEMK